MIRISIRNPRLGPATALGAALVLAAGGEARAQASELQQLLASDGTKSRGFGSAVDVDGAAAIVGAALDDAMATDAGAAYVFVLDAATGRWTEQQKLTASDAAKSDQFGAAVIVRGDVLVIGAPLEDQKGTDAGAIYVFRRDPATGTWSEEQKLMPGSGIAGDRFGSNLALDGDLLVAGAPSADPNGTDSGAAFTFRYKGTVLKWVEEAQLVDDNGAANDKFGTALVATGDTLLVGSPFANSLGSDSGAVTLFAFSGSSWSVVGELFGSQGTAGDKYGSSLALSGDLLAVGTIGDDDASGKKDVSSAYVFRWDGAAWIEEAYLLPSNPQASATFGSSVDVAHDLVVVGAYLFDEPTDCGTAYLFRLHRGQWLEDARLGNSGRGSSDNLGTSVALSDAFIFAGAPKDDVGSNGDQGSVCVYSTADTLLTITPDSPAAGAPVVIKTVCGKPGSPVMLVVVDAGGTPMFLPLIVHVFGSDYSFTITPNAPSPLFGISVGLQAWEVNYAGRLVASNVAHGNF